MVDFDKMLREKLGEEKYRELKDRKACVAERKRSYAEMTDDDLIVDALHALHNAGFWWDKKRGVNGYGEDDPVYDSAFVYLIAPRLLLRMMHASARFSKDAEVLEAGKTIKCPCPGCTGYVDFV